MLVHGALRPVVARLSVPASAQRRQAPEGRPCRSTSRAWRPCTCGSLITDLATRPRRSCSRGWVGRTPDRTLTVRWPSGAKLAAGSYRVSVSGSRPPPGGPASSCAHISRRGDAASCAAPTPAGPAAACASPRAARTRGCRARPSRPPKAPCSRCRARTASAGPENRFGAPRNGYYHEGQDVLTAEGHARRGALRRRRSQTTSYQAGGAGYYLVEHTHVGFDFMYAHCQADSFAVKVGQAVTAGQRSAARARPGTRRAPTCTSRCGSAAGRRRADHPIDPLPYLEAWAAEGLSAARRGGATVRGAAASALASAVAAR